MANVMKLLGFRVISFRSVEDSGWIDASEVTALIGTNESGKTNLLLPLWKFNPARDGAINESQDFPRARFAQMRQMSPKPVFIETRFETPEALRAQLAALTAQPAERFETVEVAKTYGGVSRVTFPKLVLERTARNPDLQAFIASAQADIKGMTPEADETEMVGQKALTR